MQDCGASVPENRLPLDEEVRLYRDVLRLLQAAQDPEKYDWGTNVSAARYVFFLFLVCSADT